MQLSATHDGIGHIVLVVTMSGHWLGMAIPGCVDRLRRPALEPGSLEETARRMSDLLGVNQAGPESLSRVGIRGL